MTQASSGATNPFQILEEYWRRQSANAGLGLEPIVDLFSDAFDTISALVTGEPVETIVDPIGYAGTQSDSSYVPALFDSSANFDALGAQSAFADDNGMDGLSEVTDAFHNLGTSLENAVPLDARGFLIQIFTLIAQAFETILDLVAPAGDAADPSATDTLGSKKTASAALFSAFGDEMSSSSQSAAGSMVPFFSPDSQVAQDPSIVSPYA